MSIFIAVFASVLALQQTTPAPSPVALESSLCAGLDNSYECAKAIETHQLAKPDLARVATRTARGLRLQLSNGKTVTVRDTGGGDDVESVYFSFRDYLADIGYFLLHRQSYEGRDYVLINARSARRFVLHDVPVISPDRVRLVTASPGLGGAYAANAVQIWRVEADGMRLEFELRPKDWEPSDAAWLDNATIRLTRQAPLSSNTRTFSTTVLVRVRGEWTVESS